MGTENPGINPATESITLTEEIRDRHAALISGMFFFVIDPKRCHGEPVEP